MYPTKAQAAELEFQVDEACRLYNAALEERKSAWRAGHVQIGYMNQAAQLKEIRSEGHIGIANFSACQDVLRRVDKASPNFSPDSPLVKGQVIRAFAHAPGMTQSPGRAWEMAAAYTPIHISTSRASASSKYSGTALYPTGEDQDRYGEA